jgi:uncharacterized membrane protein
MDLSSRRCSRCGFEEAFGFQESPLSPKTSNWWYLVVVLFGFFGGIVSLAVNRSRDPKKAIHFLILEIILQVLEMIISMLIVFNLVFRVFEGYPK